MVRQRGPGRRMKERADGGGGQGWGREMIVEEDEQIRGRQGR
uniref:Uncharacterized protein n=1 Tax=Arundo donax TaxID=35708 RepID=A0A0A9BPB3_ARUDO